MDSLRRFLLTVLLLTGVFTPATGQAQPPAQKPTSRLDHYGDPLPEHALLRIGTKKLRDSSMPQAMAFTPSGEKLVSIDGGTGVHVWDVKSGKELKAFGRLASRAAPFAVTADGSQAALVESDDACFIYDTSTAKKVGTLTGSWKPARKLCFSANKKYLACVGEDQKVTVWDVAAGKSVGQLECKSQWRALTIAFAPDNKTLAVGSWGNPTVLWDVESGKEASINGGEGCCGSMCFSPDGKYFAVVAVSWRHCSVWEVASGKRLFVLPSISDSFWCVSFTPDSKSLVTGTYPGKITFWNVATGHLQRTIAGQLGEVEGIVFSGDGKVMAAGSGGCTVRIWDVDEGKQRHVFAGHHAFLGELQLTADGATIVSLCSPWYGGTTLRLMDATTGLSKTELDIAADRIAAFWLPRPAGSLKDAKAAASAVVACWLIADGPLVALAGADGKISLHNLLTGKTGAALEAPAGSMEGLQLSDDGRFLAAEVSKPVDIEGALVPVRVNRTLLQVWEVATGKSVMAPANKQWEDLSCKFSADGRYLAVLSAMLQPTPEIELFLMARGGTFEKKQRPAVSFWDLRTGRPTMRVGPRLSLDVIGSFSPSGRLMIKKESDGGGISLLELASAQSACRLRSDVGKITCLAFSPDGRVIAAGTEQGKVILWRIDSEKPVVELGGHEGGILSLSFSGDGKRLLSGGRDTTILLWDVARWTELPKQAKGGLNAAVKAKLWKDLADPDPAGAYAAIKRLLQAPKDAVGFLGEQLKQDRGDLYKDIARWIVELDSTRYAERQLATANLEKLGLQGQQALQKVLEGNPPLEVRRRVEILLSKLETQPYPPELLRTQRALETLELLGTPEAAELLEFLSRGAPEGWLTEEATWALKRVRNRGVK